MGLHCCKSEEEAKETDDYNQNTYGNTYNQNNNDDIFKTRPPCWFGHHCPCPCHNQGSDRGGSCIFKLKSK
jgi:hypothetical protein